MDNMNNVPVNNRNNAFAANNAVNFAIELQNTLSQIVLPPHCTLRPYNQNFARCVIIEFVHPQSNHTGHVMLSEPNRHDGEQHNGFVEMLCSIDRFNGYYLEITVDNLEEMLTVIAFSQNLLQYQPDQPHLDFVRVPPHLLNHWCVPQRLRNLNLLNQNYQI